MDFTKVFLCGMPGSGKTTLARKLASYFSATHYDLDDLIETAENSKISTIFNSKGEEYFRKVEHDCLVNLINNKSSGLMEVISLGGGTPCYFNNISLINDSGITLFIDTPVEVIAKRMLDNHETFKRPLLSEISKEGLQEELQLKYDKRFPYYDQAFIKIKGDESISFISSLIISKQAEFLL